MALQESAEDMAEAGDELAAAAREVDEYWQDDCVTRDQIERLFRAAQAWKDVRS